MFSSKTTAILLAATSMLTACGGGAANNAVPNVAEPKSLTSQSLSVQSVASANASGATPIQFLTYNGYYYPWLNFSAGASVVPYLASVVAPQAIIIAAGLASREAYAIELQSGQATFVENTVNGTVILKAPKTRIIPGNTYFILGTYDGSTARLYINGTLSASAPITGGVWNDQKTGEAIGADVNGKYPFNGIISNVTILPSTITPTPSPYSTPPIAPTPMQTLPPTPPPSGAPTPTPRSTLAPTGGPTLIPNLHTPTFTPGSISLLALGSSATADISETDYTGPFSVSSSCPDVAAVTQSGNSVMVTATGAGTCSVTASDKYNQEVTLPVTVTLTNLQFQ